MKFYDRNNCSGFLEADAGMVSIRAEYLSLDYGDENAIPFIVVGNRVFFGKRGEQHGDMYYDIDYMDGESIEGRYWFNQDVMGFWYSNGHDNDYATLIANKMPLIIRSFNMKGIRLSNTRVCLSFLTKNGRLVVVLSPQELSELKPTVPNRDFFYTLSERQKKLEQKPQEPTMPNGMSVRDYMRHMAMYENKKTKHKNMKNNVIKIEESKLQEMVQGLILETVKRILKEGIGDPWYNVPGTRLVSNDEVEYKGKIINVDDLEDLLWDRYMDEIQEIGFGTEGYDEAFSDWMWRQGPITLGAALDDMIAAGQAR